MLAGEAELLGDVGDLAAEGGGFFGTFGKLALKRRQLGADRLKISVQLGARGFEGFQFGDDDSAALAEAGLLDGDVFALDVDGAQAIVHRGGAAVQRGMDAG